MLHTSFIWKFHHTSPDELLALITDSDLERVGEWVPGNNTLPAKHQVI